MILLWMLEASQAAVLAGSVLLAAILAFNFAGTLLEFGMLLMSVALVAAIIVNLVVLSIAFPIRLLWKRTFSVFATTCFCSLAGGTLYSSPLILDAYTAFFTDTNLMIGDGSPQDAIQGITVLFLIGALFGAFFGYFYSRLEMTNNAKH